MNTQCVILLGGILPNGVDGRVTSRGMLTLGKQLAALPDTTVVSYNWGDWQKASAELGHVVQAVKPAPLSVVIGYSGGGMTGMYLANRCAYYVDLLVLYDPSPPLQIETLKNNLVRLALCYHNTKPNMWWPGIGKIGGGELQVTSGYTGKHIQLDFAQWHLSVQNNKDLHARTIAAVKALQAGNYPFK